MDASTIITLLWGVGAAISFGAIGALTSDGKKEGDGFSVFILALLWPWVWLAALGWTLVKWGQRRPKAKDAAKTPPK